MAVAEITSSLARIFVSRNTFRVNKLPSQIRLIPHLNARLSPTRCELTTTCGSTASSRSGGGTGEAIALPGWQTGMPAGELKDSMRVHLGKGSCWRGYSSKAYMKYLKRKKAPIDRFGSLDPSQPKLGFEKVKALEDADENVKKIFSLEFASGNDLHKMRKRNSQEMVRDKPDTRDDLPVKIATITEHIRALAPHVENNKKDSINKVRMLNAIDRRRKMLKYLRKRNYARFERLLEELNLSWSPPPAYYKRETRRAMEKRAVVRASHFKRVAALREFEERWRAERMLEIARLKEELGKELEEEEREVLERNRSEQQA